MGELTFEEALERLERVVGELEKGKLTLEESLATFQEGVRLLRLCIARLNQFEEETGLLLKDYYTEAPPWLTDRNDGGGGE